MTKEEFKKTYIRMMDSCRYTRDLYNGQPNCRGVACNSDSCPFFNFCNENGSEKSDVSYNAFEIIEAVEKWGQEHPIKTRAQKYKEVFGVYPKYRDTDRLFCPGAAKDKDYCDTHGCDTCKLDYWYTEEYIEPEKEN